jgi:hypothetical protein
MHRPARLIIFGVVALIAVLIFTMGVFDAVSAAGYGGGGQCPGQGCEPPYGPPGDAGPPEGNAHPGWGGSEGNKGPHGP